MNLQTVQHPNSRTPVQPRDHREQRNFSSPTPLDTLAAWQRGLSAAELSAKRPDQNRLDQLDGSHNADRGVIATAVNLADHGFARFNRVVDPHREISLRRTDHQRL